MNRRRHILIAILFLAPGLVWYAVFLVYPMVVSFVVSLTDWDGLSPRISFVGLENYRRFLFEDFIARRALLNNVLWTLGTVTLPTTAGLLLAVALNNRRLRGRSFLRAAFYGPSVLPLVAVGIIWAWMYDPNFGFINEVLRLVGLGHWARGWLSDYSTAFAAAFLASVWNGVGFPMVLYLAGLQSIPDSLYEAASIDGASPAQAFIHITLPALRETHVIVGSLAVIQSFKVFDMIYTMTWGGPGQVTQVLGTWMYFHSFQYYNTGYGAAIAWVIATITALVAIPYIRVMSRD